MEKLEIESWTGANKLHLQFKCSEQERNEAGDAYTALALLFYNALLSKYRQLGLSKFGSKDFYKVKTTYTTGGIYCGINFAGPATKDEALAVVREMLDYVDQFVATDHYYANKRISSIIRDHLEDAKKIADDLRKDIFDKGSIEYFQRKVDPCS